MELVIRKFGNSTGLTLPAALLRDMGLAVGQVLSLNQTEDGALMLRVKANRKKYTAKELNADLEAWDQMKPMGNESL